MFEPGDSVFWTDSSDYHEGVISRRSYLFSPKLVWTVVSEGMLYYKEEKDLELLSKVDKA